MFYWLPLKGQSLFALLYLLTRERVYILFQADLVRGYVLLKLVSYVLFNGFSVPSNGIDIIATAPEVTISIFVFHVCVPVEDHKCTLSFEIAHDLCNAVLGWDTYQHVYMIRA